MTYDVNNLKQIDEFKDLDYWTLVKIAEVANNNQRLNEVSDLEQQLESKNDDIESLEYDISEKEEQIEELVNLIKQIYETKNGLKPKELISDFYYETGKYYFTWFWIKDD